MLYLFSYFSDTENMIMSLTVSSDRVQFSRDDDYAVAVPHYPLRGKAGVMISNEIEQRQYIERVEMFRI